MNGCETCNKSSDGRRYCDCGSCCCCHIGWICPKERDSDVWIYWKMMDSDLKKRPELRNKILPKKSQIITLPCDEQRYHGQLRHYWTS